MLVKVCWSSVVKTGDQLTFTGKQQHQHASVLVPRAMPDQMRCQLCCLRVSVRWLLSGPRLSDLWPDQIAATVQVPLNLLMCLTTPMPPPHHCCMGCLASMMMMNLSCVSVLFCAGLCVCVCVPCAGPSVLYAALYLALPGTHPSQTRPWCWRCVDCCCQCWWCAGSVQHVWYVEHPDCDGGHTLPGAGSGGGQHVPAGTRTGETGGCGVGTRADAGVSWWWFVHQVFGLNAPGTCSHQHVGRTGVACGCAVTHAGAMQCRAG